MGDRPYEDKIYKGEVTNVSCLGYYVKLLGFKKNYEGLIHKSLIDNATDELLLRGSSVTVKLVSIDKAGFITLSLISVEPTVQENDMNSKNSDRVIRISSPERYQVKQLSTSVGYTEVKLKSDPVNLGLKGLNLSATNGTFSSVTNIPKGFMLSNAVRNRSQPFGAFTDFMKSNINFNQTWQRGECLNETSANVTNEDPVEVWSTKKRSALLIKKQREMLPIFADRERFIKAVTNNRVLIVQGETGSGKSTQIPQYLLEAGFTTNGKIVCTQPRKMVRNNYSLYNLIILTFKQAAQSLAVRVAEEQGVAIGDVVGYKYRFCDRTSNATLIKYCTEGTLLRECLNAGNLNNYSVVIMDEAHERSRDLDVLFGILKKELAKIPHLRVIVSSATMEANKFSKFFDNAPIFQIKGRAFPVEVFYRLNDVYDYFNASILTALHIHKNEKPGDILLFLTGQDEIEYACEIFEEMRDLAKDLVVLKIFSALPYDEQIKVFEAAPERCRKLIIATNVAETSMTIPGIVYVIDPGYAKLKMFIPKSGIETLDLLPISKASADQRTGRAGRTAPGKCYRLYTRQSYMTLLGTAIPEIQRTDLANVVLQFKAMGIDDASSIAFIDPPSREALFMAEKQLYGLAALDVNLKITSIGRRMVDFPLEPKLSKMLIKSIDLKCSSEIITIIAMLTVQNVFYRPRKKRSAADAMKAEMSSSVSDHITLLNVFQMWQKNNYSESWCKKNFINSRSMNEAFETRDLLLDKMDQNRIEVFSAGKNIERIQKAICAGFAHNLAKRSANPRKFTYQPFHDNAEVFIHPSSSLMKAAPPW